jgi:signal transduction histidine kinase/ActR/RegA family two-component response regulator
MSYSQTIISLLRSGDYSLTSRLLPVFTVIGIAGHIGFYFLLSALGMRESAFIRFGTAALLLPGLCIRSGRRFGPWLIAYCECAIACALPLSFTYLFLLNDMSTYWWTSLFFGGVFYGLLSGRFYHTVTIFPVATALGGALFVALHQSSFSLFLAGRAAYVIACFSAICAGGFRLAIDVFYRMMADYESLRVKAQGAEELKKVAEEKLRMEQELRQSQKLEAIGLLAGGIAHDFNNQLVAISISAEMLKRTLSAPDDLELIDCIISAARQSGSLTRQLLTFSRGSRDAFRELSVHDLIRETAGMLARSIDKRVTITTRCEARNDGITGDAGLLQNALLNLGINAGQAMPRGGSLAITTTCWNTTAPCPPGARRSREALNDAIMILAADTGCGMNEETQSKAFEPFFTTKRAGEGTGMGLSVVYGTAKSHGGCTCCESAPGAGTRIRICLPLTRSGVQKESNESELILGAGTVMLIDDETLVRSSLARLLSALGYTPVTFAGGGDALEYFAQNHHTVDLILLDMIMPEMSGRELFDALRAIDPRARIVMITGYAARGSVEDLLAKGAADCIGKPVQPDEFARAIKKALDSPAGPG